MLEIEDYEGEDYRIVRFSVEKIFLKLKKGVKIVREKWSCFWMFKNRERVTKREARMIKTEMNNIHKR